MLQSVFKYLLVGYCCISSQLSIGVYCWGCCSTRKLSDKSEIFRLSEILGCPSEIFITYLYKKRTLYYCKNVSSSPNSAFVYTAQTQL